MLQVPHAPNRHDVRFISCSAPFGRQEGNFSSEGRMPCATTMESVRVEGLMYLADTNIFLEALLEQERTDEVRSFFQAIGLNEIFMTDLSLHSIGIIMFRLKKFTLFVSFLEDMVVDGVGILSLTPEELKRLDQVAQKFNLDFDDAYQYVVAENYDLQLISFDTDFDRTGRKRKEPAEVLK